MLKISCVFKSIICSLCLKFPIFYVRRRYHLISCYCKPTEWRRSHREETSNDHHTDASAVMGGSRELWPCYHLDTHLLLIWAMEDVALNHEKSSYYFQGHFSKRRVWCWRFCFVTINWCFHLSFFQLEMDVLISCCRDGIRFRCNASFLQKHSRFL